MTNEEAIQDLRNTIQSDYVWSRESIEMGIQAIEKQEKYKWHDLKKNPEDLPQNTDFFLVKYEWEDGDYLNQIDRFERGKWGCDKPYCKGKVVAWKCIELFEEEE